MVWVFCNRSSRRGGLGLRSLRLARWGDTPPMLQMPDARVIGRIADGVLLVFRAGQTRRDAAIAARQRFGEDETRVLGTILNGWDPKRSPNGYYGYSKAYGYDRGYGY